MSDFFDLVQRRRSVRKFTEQPVEKEKIDKIMRVALMAPSGKRVNPWKFILVTDKEMLQKLSEAREHGSQLIAGASLAIVVMADTSLTDVWVEDTSIASSYIQLEVEELGLGSCWVQVRNRMKTDNLSAEKYIRGLLNIPEKYAIENMVAIGYKTEEKFPHDLSSLQYDKVNVEKYSLLDGEQADDTQQPTMVKDGQAEAKEERPNHPYNNRLIFGTILAFFGLLFFLRKIVTFTSPIVNDLVFGLNSCVIYVGLIFILLRKFGRRNQRTGLLLVMLGVGLHLFNALNWISWLDFLEIWPLILLIVGVMIVYFALQNGKCK